MALDAILPGRGASDYERYLRTDELLALQKSPEEMNHRDELLFTTVHQTSELWLKLAVFEVEEATTAAVEAALRCLARAVQCVGYVTDALSMLERMSPWEFHQVRSQLGHGAGFDSPGFRQLHALSPALWRRFQEELGDVSLVDLYVHGREHEQLYQLAEVLLELDERVVNWRQRHVTMVERMIGGSVIGTKGTPVEVLRELMSDRWFPELWQVRDDLTALAGTSPA
ncbi:MAG TPA: tryptophan 2,3-dioxygenase family protein [Gaiellaceae bacterium]